MKYLPIIWSNLKHRKLRTVLTLLSIMMAFLLYGMLCIIQESFSAGVKVAGADRLMVRHKSSIIQTLPFSYTQRIQAIPGVDAVSHNTWFGGKYQNKENFFPTIPVNPEAFLNMYPEYVLPEDQKKEWFRKRTGAIVGKDTAAKYQWKIGDIIPITSPIWGQPKGEKAWKFELVGIYEPGKQGADASTFYFHYDYFEEGRQRKKGEVGWFGVRVKDPAEAGKVASLIDQEFANSAYETKAETEAAMAQGFANQVGDIGAILMGIIGAVFFTILLVAGNTMHQAVRERTVELGVLKALGFKDGLVLLFVLGESLLISLLGGGVGLALAWLIAQGGSPVPDFLPVFYLPDSALRSGVAYILLLGLAAGLLPALQAMRLQIAVALRRQG